MKEGFVFSGTWTELVPPSRVAYRIDDGRPVTIDLTERGGKTHLVLGLTLETMYPEEQQRQGWGEFLEKLDGYLRAPLAVR